MIIALPLIWSIIVPLTFGKIRILQGATNVEIKLKGAISKLGRFKKDMMGRNGYHQLNFEKVEARELSNLPNDIFHELNEKQARQIIERYKEELAKKSDTEPFSKALELMFASDVGKEDKLVNWLDPEDIDTIGFVPAFMPVSLLCKELLGCLISRWSARPISPLIKKELLSVDLEQLVKNKKFRSMKLEPAFFKNLHSQVPIEQWPGFLKDMSIDAGVKPKKLNKELGGYKSESESDSSSSEYSEEDDEEYGDYDDEEEEKHDNRKKIRGRGRKSRKGAHMRTANALLRPMRRRVK